MLEFEVIEIIKPNIEVIKIIKKYSYIVKNGEFFIQLLHNIFYKLASHFLPDLVYVQTHKPKATTPMPPKTMINPSIILSFNYFITKKCQTCSCKYSNSQ